MNFKVWIAAFRLRTLFLSFACIGLGIILAYLFNKNIDTPIAVFTFITALFLQILSNLANDYGDSIHGADNKFREGPARAVQSGKISLKQMKTALIVCGALSFFSGVFLLILSLKTIGTIGVITLFVIGILAIAAAIFYTNGKKPYGYIGLGDLSVFLFFGITAVLGSFYLQTGNFNLYILLPASGIGLLSVGVLNINNMRDIPSDTLAGKRSIPVIIGLKNAKLYHACLIISALVLFTLFALIFSLPHWYMLVYFLLLFQLKNIYQTSVNKDFDRFLKQLSLSTFLLVILYSLCIYYA